MRGSFFMAPDRTHMQRRRKMLLFMKVLFTQFIAEMGDKTQLMLVAMTSKFKLKDILLGTGVAILVLNGLAVLAGEPCQYGSSYVADPSDCRCGVPVFAATTLKGDDDEEENLNDRKIKFAPLSVFCTFFVAELGDKTQLTAITFGANEGLSAAVVVWLACSLGLFAADVIGLLIGYLLKSKAPGGNCQYSCVFYFFHFWNSDAETGIRASAWSRICYDSSADSCGYSSICDRLSCAYSGQKNLKHKIKSIYGCFPGTV